MQVDHISDITQHTAHIQRLVGERAASGSWNAPQAETPENLLRVDGRSARLVRSQQCYLAAEAREGMFAWNGAEDNLIDRFDGRALLDFYREPDDRSRRPKTEDELELDAVRCRPRSAPLAALAHT